MKLSKLSVALLAATTSSVAFAESTSLSQVIVTANKVSQPIESVTANVTIISAEELEAKHFTTVTEALNQIAGISFTKNGPLGTTTNLFIRGSGNSRALILVDGIRTNDPSSTAGSNLSNLVVANIERIEIIKGAQSGVWGSDAAAGVINIITKDNKETQISLEYGAYNTRKVALNTGLKSGNTTFSLNAQRLETDGFSAQAPAGQDINQYEDDPYSNTNVIAKMKVNLTDNKALAFTHNHTNALASYDSWGNPDGIQRAQTQSDLTNINYQNGDTEVSLQQSLFRTEQLDSASADIVNGKTQSIQLTHKVDNLLVGVAHSINKATTDKYGSFKQSNNHSNALFATLFHKQGNISFNEALRWDDYSNFDAKITGKLGAKYAINNTNSIAVNYGTAYNAPSLIQIINPWGTANPDLAPENSEEISLDIQRNNLTLSLFDKRVNNLINWQGGQYQNVAGTTQIRGYEAEYKVSFNTIDLAANYTHLHTEKANGDSLERRPEDQIGLDINWYAANNLDINLNGQYIGKRSEGNYTQYYSVWNTSVNYQVNKTVSTYLKIDNVFNTYYQVVNGYATAERSAYLGFNAKF